MFNLFKAKKRSAITITLTPKEGAILKQWAHAAYVGADNLVQTKCSAEEILRQRPDQWPKEYMQFLYAHRWQRDLEEHPTWIQFVNAVDANNFVVMLRDLHNASCQQYQTVGITGPGADLVSYGERVAVVNAVVARITAQVGLA